LISENIENSALSERLAHQWVNLKLWRSRISGLTARWLYSG
jgi:hypothetical protein